MLKDTLQRFQGAESSPDFEKNSTTATDLFYGFLDYLEDRQQFPNPEINSLAVFFRQLLKDGHVTLVFYEKEELFPYLAFFIDTEGPEQTPRFYIPQSFVSEVAEKPERQIGVIASLMSQSRDFFCAKFNGENLDEVGERGMAYEAEALNTLVDLAEQEQVGLDLSHFQIALLAKFPKGVIDLDEWLWYSNPEYKKTFSPPKDKPSKN